MRYALRKASLSLSSRPGSGYEAEISSKKAVTFSLPFLVKAGAMTGSAGSGREPCQNCRSAIAAPGCCQSTKPRSQPRSLPFMASACFSSNCSNCSSWLSLCRSELQAR